MDGILLIDKEKDWTSRDVINVLNHRFHTKKIGHIGTLDPFATGLLVVTIGRATKIGSYLEAMEKTYEATITFGEDTDTLDCCGRVVEKKEVPPFSEKQLQSVLRSFVGNIRQQVPLYAAVKVQGKELYKYARAKQKVALPIREVTIHSLQLLSYDSLSMTIKVTCSKGTYIRQLGQDIAHALSTCGHLTALRRLQIGRFQVENAHLIQEVTASSLLPLEEGLSHLDAVIVNEKVTQDIQNGKRIVLAHHASLLVAYDGQKRAIAILEKQGDFYQVKRGLWS